MPSGSRQPVLFLAHGDPMNALRDNAFTRKLSGMAETLPARPAAVLVVSAHWQARSSFACSASRPETIHDFSGFPDELFKVEYPAPGAPELAAKVAERITNGRITEDWGLDHGAWTVLKHLFPEAEVPVFQLSIDASKSLKEQFKLGRALYPLRKDGLLIIGSGNIVHNLARIRWNGEPYEWARAFDAWVAARLDSRDADALCDLSLAGEEARLSCPSLEHYVPLVYAMGAASGGSSGLGRCSYPYEGFEHGSLSMRCVSWD
jgi:4,5-DOPA dioxygenase extradiol